MRRFESYRTDLSVHDDIEAAKQLLNEQTYEPTLVVHPAMLGSMLTKFDPHGRVYKTARKYRSNGTVYYVTEEVK